MGQFNQGQFIYHSFTLRGLPNTVIYVEFAFHQCRRKLVIQSNPQRALCGKTDSQVKYLSHTITRKRTYGTCDVDLTWKRMKKRLRDYKTTTTTTTNKQTNRHTHMNSKFIDSNMYLPPIRQSELRLAHLSRKWTLPQCASNNQVFLWDYWYVLNLTLLHKFASFVFLQQNQNLLTTSCQKILLAKRSVRMGES